MIRRHPGGFVLAGLFAASLGFGAVQALAAPAAPSPERACSNRECRAYCATHGAQGSCVGGMCVCYIPVEE